MIDKLVDGLARMIMGVSALLVFAITFLQVLCRFVLKSPLPWSTDILRLAFTYLVFWGAAWCVREKEHLNVDVVLTALPAGIRRWTEILINLILCVFLLWNSVLHFWMDTDHILSASSYDCLLCEYPKCRGGNALLHG